MRILLVLSLMLTAFQSAGQFSSYVCNDHYDSTAYIGRALPIQKTADGGYLTMHATFVTGPDDLSAVYGRIIKTNAALEPEWFMGAISSQLVPFADSTIGIFANGLDSIGASFIKISDAGTYLSTRSYYGDSVSFYFTGSAAIPTGSRVITHNAFGHSSAPFIIDMDKDGNVLSADTMHIPMAADYPISPSKIVTDAAGNTLITTSWSFHLGVFISCLQPDKSPIWTNYIYSADYIGDYSMVRLSDGSVIAAASLTIVDSSRIILFKFSPIGNLIWQKIATSCSGISDMKLLSNGHVLLINGANVIYPTNWSPRGGRSFIEIDTAANVISTTSYQEPIDGSFFASLSAPAIMEKNKRGFLTNTCWPYRVSFFTTDSNGHGLCPWDTFAIAFQDISAFNPISQTLSLAPQTVHSDVRNIPISSLPQPYSEGCAYDYIPTNSVAIVPTLPFIEIYPNPANQRITIQISNNEPITAIAVYDVSGRERLKVNLDGAREMDISLVPQGYYTLNIVTEKSVYHSKLIVRH